ncbi:RICIN domain-containing protein [Paenibacillus chondroitinus]|uniref:RICIN domain-containing protein n=1 Tax=Paenibacillus chondroitinus TaxID=59842 RepID=A0ABU6D9S5_9BACL|nr:MULTISPECIES: RICIN domain-containing protein [Paenibacillus]MCY9656823.1 RICIN domain-containing protein [Paenibacillus anseongense]MEB4794473.1 RICIN domain-containing protein [Paenibacillus chondroitinus]
MYESGWSEQHKASSATAGIISGETYTIIAKHSGLTVGVSGANNTLEGSSVIQGSDASLDEAKWEITNLDGLIIPTACRRAIYAYNWRRRL